MLLNVWDNCKIFLSENRLGWKRTFKRKMDFHVLYYIVQIFCIMAPLSWFNHAFCCSCEQCCLWACYIQVPLSFLDYFWVFSSFSIERTTSKKQDPSFCSFELKIKYAICELQSWWLIWMWLNDNGIENLFNMHWLCL